MNGATEKAILAGYDWGARSADIVAALIRRNVAVHAFNQRDIAGIFAMIGGTYPPLAVFGLGGEMAAPLLVFNWIAAIAGAAVSFNSSSSSTERLAKLLTKFSGFLISCAMPAVSWPNEAIFSA